LVPKVNRGFDFMNKNIFIFMLLLLCLNHSDAQIFTRITGDPVVSDDRYSEGSSWGDLNSDGYPDLFVPDLHQDKKNILFLNNTDGTFTQVTNGPVVTDVSRSSGGCFGDLNNDGDLDLFVCNYFNFNNFLYTNNGDGTFSKVTNGIIVNDGGNSFGSSMADYDNDGFLDIYVVNGAFTTAGANNFFYKNNGDATFTKITTGALVNDGEHSSSSAWCDYDDDGDQDLFVANGATYTPAEADNVIYQNNGDGTFSQINPGSIGLENSYSSNGSWGDYDNDGEFDLFITNFLGNNNILFKNNGDGTFTKITTGIIVNDGGDSVSSSWGDYDNDGDLDLYVTNDYNENNVLYENNGDGTFTKITTGSPVNDGGRSNGATWVDYNNDGYLDLFVPNGQRPLNQSNILYKNNAMFNNNWVNIKCVGSVSNTSAVGTKLRVKALINGSLLWQVRQVSSATGFNAQNSFNLEFGLGDATHIDSLIVEWPSGTLDIFYNTAVNTFYEAVEGGGLNTIFSSLSRELSKPQEYMIVQNYPNPFNPATTIPFTLNRSTLISLKVFNNLGQEVRTLLNYQSMGPGAHRVAWDGRNDAGSSVSSGIYLYRIQIWNDVISRQMILTK
jgi:hypothetical protein